MATANEFGFDYVFGLARKLTPEEQSLLAERLATPEPDENDDKFVIVTVDTGNPIFTPEELAEFERRGQELLSRRTPKEIEANRQAWKRFVDEFPEIGEEEICAMEQARKEINECRLASL